MSTKKRKPLAGPQRRPEVQVAMDAALACRRGGEGERRGSMRERGKGR